MVVKLLLLSGRCHYFREFLHLTAELSDINISGISDDSAVPSPPASLRKRQPSQHFSVQVLQEPAYPDVLVFRYEERGNTSVGLPLAPKLAICVENLDALVIP